MVSTPVEWNGSGTEWLRAGTYVFTCSGKIFVPHATRAFDMKRPFTAFRRDVDESVAVEGCRRDPEHVLLQDPWYEIVGDFVEQLHSGTRFWGEG